MTEEKSITRIQGNELLDLLENTGVLQEVNRSFFHPLGLNLKLEKDLTIALEETSDKHGFISDTVNTLALKTFMQFAQEKHRKRHEIAGFIIQTKDMLRSNKLEVPVTSINTLKLQTLLKELDNFTYEIKRRFMEKSKDYDNDLNDYDEDNLYHLAFEDLQKGNIIDAVARAMIIQRIEHINLRLKKLREIKKEQDRVYKEK